MTLHRLAQATPDQQRELIEELWMEVHSGKDAKWFAAYADDGKAWEARKFLTMLDCGAYLDAVMLMVPEGCLYMARTVWVNADNPLAATAGYASVDKYTQDDDGIFWKENHLAIAQTPALALACAIAELKGI